ANCGAAWVIFATSSAVAPCALTPGRSTGPLSWDRSGGVCNVAPTTTPISPGTGSVFASLPEEVCTPNSILNAAQVTTTCWATVCSPALKFCNKTASWFDVAAKTNTPRPVCAASSNTGCSAATPRYGDTVTASARSGELSESQASA